MNARRAAVSCALLLAACSSLRWSGAPQIPPSENAPPAAAREEAKSAPVRPRPRVVVPQAPADRRRAALFYSDLGPDSIDVSGYPTQQKYNYEVYRKTCARCHSLARSVNAPYVTRGWWEFYVMSMRARARWQGEPLTPEETRAVLDFLEYDSNERKAGRAAEFEEVKLELKRRFESALDERMEELQRNAPKLR